MMYKNTGVHTITSLAHQRYEQAGLLALHRAMVPPCIALSLWNSLKRRGWRPGIKAQPRIQDVLPDKEPRKYATLAAAVTTALSRLSCDAALVECCSAYQEPCDVYERALNDHACLMNELMRAVQRTTESV